MVGERRKKGEGLDSCRSGTISSLFDVPRCGIKKTVRPCSTGRGRPSRMRRMTAATILCFGDSNTWGFIPGSDCERYAPNVRWPGVMAADFGPGYRVVEEAQNGHSNHLGRPCGTLCQQMRPYFSSRGLGIQKPIDLVIIMLGTNNLKLT